MKKAAINLAIAEYLGLEMRRQNRKGHIDPNGVVIAYKFTDVDGWYSWKPMPNYCEDLNAMNNAELWLKKDDPHAYGCYVTELMDGEADAISKSAAERAEMFVRIIGKWID